jgi:tetratricopeptide (TPR) repeat protein
VDGELIGVIVAAIVVLGGLGALLIYRRRKDKAAAAPANPAPNAKPERRPNTKPPKNQPKKKDEVTAAPAVATAGDTADIEKLVAGGHIDDAARLAMRKQLWDKAAQLYMRLEQPANAAHCAKRAGKNEMAAELYEKSGDIEAAIRMWEKAGDFRRARELGGTKHTSDAPEDDKIHISPELQAEIDRTIEKKDFVRAAELYEQAGDKENAAEQLAKFAQSARRPEIYAEKVQALSPRVAFNMLRLATKGRPPGKDSADLYRRLAGLQHHFGNKGAATETLAKLLEALPDDEATRELYEQVSGEPSPHPDLQPADAAGLLADERVKQAKSGPSIPELVALIGGRGCDLGNIEVFYRLGLACLAVQRHEDAARAFQAVVDASPGYRDAEARLKELGARAEELGTRN